MSSKPTRTDLFSRRRIAPALLAVLVLSGLSALLYQFGAVTPCGILKTKVREELALAEANRIPQASLQEFAPYLSFSLGASPAEEAIEALSQFVCTGQLAQISARGSLLQKGIGAAAAAAEHKAAAYAALKEALERRDFQYVVDNADKEAGLDPDGFVLKLKAEAEEGLTVKRAEELFAAGRAEQAWTALRDCRSLQAEEARKRFAPEAEKQVLKRIKGIAKTDYKSFSAVYHKLAEIRPDKDEYYKNALLADRKLGRSIAANSPH